MYFVINEKGEGKFARDERELLQLVEAGYLPPGFTPLAIQKVAYWIKKNGGSYEKILALSEKLFAKDLGGKKK